MPTPHQPSPFAAEVGLSAPLRVSYAHRGGGGEGTVEVGEPFALLGRHARCSVRLEDSSVSRRHAFLLLLSGNAFVADLNSRRGVQVGESHVSQGWLPHGQIFQVGEFDVRVLPGPDPAGKPPMNWEGPPLSLVRGDDATPTVYPLRAAVTVIGRDVTANLTVRDDRLDLFHAVLVRTAATTWVVSLHGVGGVRVNGRQVRAARVGVGDRLELNGLTLRLEPYRPTDNPLVTVPRTEPADDARELTLTMVKMFTAFQQEQTDLLRRQTELLQVIADAMQRGGHALPAVATPDALAVNDRPAEAPVPQASLPREAEALEDAHKWLMERLLTVQTRKP